MRECLSEALIKADDEAVEQLFGDVTYEFYRRFIRENTPLLTPLGKVIRHEFFARTIDYPFFINSLKKGEPKVPVGKVDKVVKTGPQAGIQHYYFILTRQQEKAIQILHADSSLDSFRSNPVRLLCGLWEDKLPTTNQLVKSQAFCYISHLFTKLGIQLGGKARYRIADLLTPVCSIPIFYWRSSSYYPTHQEEALHAFIAKRLTELNT